MDRRRFYFLYVNINSMAELALKQGLARILADLSDGADSPQPELSQEEIDAQVAASFENLDLSALDGLDLSSANAIPAPMTDEPLDFAAMESAPESDGEIDIEAYLTRAYSFEERLRQRIDQHYQRADLPALDGLLAQLPAHLPSLTGQLSAEEMTEWLTVYEQGNDVLNDLTVRVRQLDMPHGAG